MSGSRLERVKAVMPPDGADFAQILGEGGGGIDAGDLIAQDAVVRFVAPGARAEANTTGPEGFREGWANWLEAWESFRIYFDDVFERGDSVVMFVRLRGVTKHGGVEIEEEAASVFRFDGDQVVELEFNLDREDALAD
ncbi:MAG: nuclear transport factor 2 family protein [Thermoleophilaceae bacterium]